MRSLTLDETHIDRSMRPTIIHQNRETFKHRGNVYLAYPSLEELLVEAGIHHPPIFRNLVRELTYHGIQTIDDLINMNKSKMMQLESITPEYANAVYQHLILVKHRGPLLQDLQKLELYEREYYYLEFIKEIDEIIFHHSNGKYGIRSKSIIELCGPTGTGKTQWCLTAACSMLQVGKSVVYIDTENGFDTSRIKQIGLSTNISQRSILDNLYLSTIDSFDELDLVLDEVLPKIKSDRIGMIIVDSLMQLLQNTYPAPMDSKDLANRQLHLRKTMRRLRIFARSHNLIVIITNHIREIGPDIHMGLTEPLPEDTGEDLRTVVKLLKRITRTQIPMGGTTLAYSSDIRILLGIIDDSNKIAILENCAYLPRKSVKYVITQKGITLSPYNNTPTNLGRPIDSQLKTMNDLLG